MLPSHLDLIVVIDKILQAFSLSVEIDLVKNRYQEIAKINYLVSPLVSYKSPNAVSMSR